MRFHLDEHVDGAVADALRRRGIDVTTTVDAGLIGRPDLAHVAFALASRRVIVTSDADFLALDAAGVEHCGIVFCPSSRRIGQVIEFLLLADACLDEQEMRMRVEFA